jgi:hypothetical protein
LLLKEHQTGTHRFDFVFEKVIMGLLLNVMPSAGDQIYIFKVVLHQQIYDETSNKNQSEDQISHGSVTVIGSACLLIIFGLNT